RLATLLTTLFERGQYLLVRRFGTRSSPGHDPSPVVLFLLLLPLDYTRCQPMFAIQPTGTGGKPLVTKRQNFGGKGL
ncbi:MAG: hypothetical protein ACJ797_04860, partial [Ktedonobacteraceae bacterium]